MAQSLTTNPNYLVEIRKGAGNARTARAGGIGGTNSVVANAQAKLSIQIQNQWVNVLQALGMSGDSSSTGSVIFNLATLFTGNNFLPQLATSHVWRGSNGLEISLDLRFDAVNNALQDVVDPVKRLITFWSPTRGGPEGKISEWFVGLVPDEYKGVISDSFLHPPGPTPYEYLDGLASRESSTYQQKLLTVAIGRALIVTDLIPTQLMWEFEERFTKEGYPISAHVQANFISYVTPAQDEILKYFVMGNENMGG